VAVTIDLSGQVALVTGAGAGIGAEIARWLARAGAAVAVNDVRAGHASDVVASIEARAGRPRRSWPTAATTARSTAW
jgi:NAD(P)-dependent dehydrogenase (short-subunit alcohol dehydrogenase family)